MNSYDLDEPMRRSFRSPVKYGLAMDGVLLLLGGGTVWLASQYLSFDDPRPWHNAWTYAISIPVGLVIVDLVMRTVVSRFVERRFQVAFLLSMLVHLLLTIGAIHTRLFARIENQPTQSLTLAAAKHEQQSSVPEFLMTSEQPSDRKPDYLRPIETPDSQPPRRDQERRGRASPQYT